MRTRRAIEHRRDDLEPLEREEAEFDLLDCLFVLFKRKRFILGVTFGATLLTALISLGIPGTYRAESKFLPPVHNQDLSSQAPGLSGIVGAGIVSSEGIKTPGGLYLGLLQSAPVLDGVIDKTRLLELRGTKCREDLRQSLLSHVTATDDKKSGIITIAVEDGDPKLAADIANTFIDSLKKLNRRLAVTEAGQRRVFYEEQLKEVKESLSSAEESLKGFQEKTGAIQVDDQVRGVIQSLADIRTQLSAKEVQLRVMKTYATGHNPDAQKLEEEIRGLKAEIGGLEARGGLEAKGGRNVDFGKPASRMAQVNTDYQRKVREIKSDEALYEVLLKQVETARLDEAKDVAVIQVIEDAAKPERKFKPQRAKIVMVAFAASLLIALLGAFFLEFIERAGQDPERRRRLDQLKGVAFTFRKSS